MSDPLTEAFRAIVTQAAITHGETMICVLIMVPEAGGIPATVGNVPQEVQTDIIKHLSQNTVVSAREHKETLN